MWIKSLDEQLAECQNHIKSSSIMRVGHGGIFFRQFVEKPSDKSDERMTRDHLLVNSSVVERFVPESDRSVWAANFTMVVASETVLPFSTFDAFRTRNFGCNKIGLMNAPFASRHVAFGRRMLHRFHVECDQSPLFILLGLCRLNRSDETASQWVVEAITVRAISIITLVALIF